MIKIDKLKVSYGNNNVLNELCLDIASNTIHGLVGLNGSGKTTLLNTIYGLKSKEKGTIHISFITCSSERVGKLTLWSIAEKQILLY